MTLEKWFHSLQVMVMHTCSSRAPEAEAGGPWVWDQPGLCRILGQPVVANMTNSLLVLSTYSGDRKHVMVMYKNNFFFTVQQVSPISPELHKVIKILIINQCDIELKFWLEVCSLMWHCDTITCIKKVVSKMEVNVFSLSLTMFCYSAELLYLVMG
jgi:hypothetical protein